MCVTFLDNKIFIQIAAFYRQTWAEDKGPQYGFQGMPFCFLFTDTLRNKSYFKMRKFPLQNSTAKHDHLKTILATIIWQVSKLARKHGVESG